MNFHRIPEFAARVVYGALCARSIERRVQNAYANALSSDAAFLQECARVAWGLARGNETKARAYIYLAHQAQKRAQYPQRTLGPTAIGFAGIRIHALTTDENSIRDYLDGFDEGLTAFEMYRGVAPPGTVAIDVGANIGIHSLVMSECVGASGHVYSYEPRLDLRDKFLDNVALNRRENITLRSCAVMSKSGTVRFNPHSNSFNIGLGKVDPHGPIEVPVTTLDQDCPDNRRVSLIKIDVEGFELEVLRGAGSLLRTYRPALVMEYNRSWMEQALREAIPYSVNITSIPVRPSDISKGLARSKRLLPGMNILVQPVHEDIQPGFRGDMVPH